MKKLCFVHYRKDSEGKYYFKDAEPKSDFNELIGSFSLFTVFDLIKLDSIDSDTSLFISIQSIDFSIPLFWERLQSKLQSIKLKNVFYDLATYDNQEISEANMSSLSNLVDVESYIISKNIISTKENHLWFEELFFHYVKPDSLIPQNILAFKRVEDTTYRILRKFKGMFYAGHNRIHKLEFLNHLHKNDHLKDFIWSATGPDYEPDLFNEFVPIKFQNYYKTLDVVKLLPHLNDYANYDDYRDRANAYNFVSYLDSYFDVAAETRFYHVQRSPGATDTQPTWNNISEKIMKPTLMGHPFILLSKPNTISTLESMGLKYNFDFWKYEYDSILNDESRMASILSFTDEVMKMTKKELRQFKTEYNHYTAGNFNQMVKEIYPQSILNIYNKA
jgi:hypothetical protein